MPIFFFQNQNENKYQLVFLFSRRKLWRIMPKATDLIRYKIPNAALTVLLDWRRWKTSCRLCAGWATRVSNRRARSCPHCVHKCYICK